MTASCNLVSFYGLGTKIAVQVEEDNLFTQQPTIKYNEGYKYMSYILLLCTCRNFIHKKKVKAVRVREKLTPNPDPWAEWTKSQFTPGDEENRGQSVVLLRAHWPLVGIYRERKKVGAIYEWGDSVLC